MFDSHSFAVISPVTNAPIIRRPFASQCLTDQAVLYAQQAYEVWRKTPLESRLKMLESLLQVIESQRDEIADELTIEMGRPIKYTGNEVSSFCFRGRHMLELAPSVLSPKEVTTPAANNQRRLLREPLGVVLILTTWNYPYMVTVNSLIPALAAGNTVILKGSPQAPGCVERLAAAATKAGLPQGVLQYLHLSNEMALKIIKNPAIARVQFTGSVEGGRAVKEAAAGRFIGVGLELGGKDAAYVMADCDLKDTVDNLVDGAFFNSGQSCCGIERIYVANEIYDEFVSLYVEKTKEYKLGDPRDKDTTLGPVISERAADRIRAHIEDAVSRGAKALIDPSLFPSKKNYLGPQVLVNVNHSMAVMVDETFGPVVGIMPVSSDQEAINLVNDSPYGLTASIWSTNRQRAQEIAGELRVGTVFVNRCDYLDPGCAWTGCKDSGLGITLSEFGFDAFTSIKSLLLQ